MLTLSQAHHTCKFVLCFWQPYEKMRWVSFSLWMQLSQTSNNCPGNIHTECQNQNMGSLPSDHLNKVLTCCTIYCLWNTDLLWFLVSLPTGGRKLKVKVTWDGLGIHVSLALNYAKTFLLNFYSNLILLVW